MTSDDLARMDTALRRIQETGARLWTQAEIEHLVRQTLANALEHAAKDRGLTNDQ